MFAFGGTTVFVIALVAVILVLFSLLLLRRAEDDPLGKRIEEYAAREEAVSIEEIELSLPITDRVFVPLLRGIGNFVTRLAPQSTLERTAHELELAGSPRNLSPALFWASRGLLAVFMGGLFLLMMIRFNVDPSKRLLYTLLFVVVGFFLPQLWLRSLISRRQQEIVKALPDALDLMTICVDAGLTFDGAMAKVDEKWDNALAREFGRVIYEMQLGKGRRNALRDMVDADMVGQLRTAVASG